MRLASGSTVLLGTILASPALWRAFVVGDLEVQAALVRYLIALAVAAAMMGVLASITRPYREQNRRARVRRITDRHESPDAPRRPGEPPANASDAA